MAVVKRVLCPQRLRRVPQQFSWIDHRLVRDNRLAGCGPAALALCPEAPEYYRQLEQRRSVPRHHVEKILALSEIYGVEPVARALEDALHFAAFSAEYIANILEQRQRRLPEPGALHLTRQQDLLDLELPEPDLSVYEPQTQGGQP